MEKNQAEAIAQAILEPDLKVQEELRRKKSAEDRSLAQKRVAAACTLVGTAVGAVAAHLTGERFGTGVLWGAIGGSAVGGIVVALRRRRHAA